MKMKPAQLPSAAFANFKLIVWVVEEQWCVCANIRTSVPMCGMQLRLTVSECHIHMQPNLSVSAVSWVFLTFSSMLNALITPNGKPARTQPNVDTVHLYLCNYSRILQIPAARPMDVCIFMTLLPVRWVFKPI